MTWRSLLIQNGGKLSLQRRQLLIQQNDESHTVPLEDIAVIIIEKPRNPDYRSTSVSLSRTWRNLTDM